MVTERLSLEGHLIDDHQLSLLLDIMDHHGVAYKLRRFLVGENATKPSLVELEIASADRTALNSALRAAAKIGAKFDSAEVQLAEADLDGVFPEDFYSTTNFPTAVHYQGEWIEVENIEMDAAIRLIPEGDTWRAETCCMHHVKKGDRIVIGFDGVKVAPDESTEGDVEQFRFMSNEVSTERPKGRMIAECARAMRASRAKGMKTILVGGPAIIHSGSGPYLEKLIREGWIDILFAGNALAAHDIESSMLGTSLGVNLQTGSSIDHGHTHHLRAINRVRRAGSIRAAVESGLIPSGVMKTCVETNTPFVLCGSIRDDGPLPDVISDAVKAQDAMRNQCRNIGVCLMVATLLHSVATGNMLPASVATFCVDADSDSVIKLTDRGTHQAVGIVTDCEFFLKELASQLQVL